MAKRNPRAPRSWKNVSVGREAEYVASLAARRDARIVTLGPLLFFSTETGDAWVLDPEDGLALCLARDGDPIPADIVETPESFAVPWNSHYRIEGPAMTFIEASGRVRTVFGYPVREIEERTLAAKASG